MKTIEKILKTAFVIGAITTALYAVNVIKNKPVAYIGAISTAASSVGIINLSRKSRDKDYNSHQNSDYN